MAEAHERLPTDDDPPLRAVPVRAEDTPVPLDATALTPGVAAELAGERLPDASLGDLARAFQANAEALRGLHDVHADLSTAINRGDRSEMMLQSTKALNDTFRNLTSVQRELLGRMDAMQRQSKRNPIVPMMVLGVLVVLLLGIYVIVDMIQQSQPRYEELAALKEQGAEGRLDAFQKGQAQASQELRAAVARQERELADADARLTAATSERDERQDEIERLERTKRSLETERDELAERVIHSQNESMARTLVEDELRGLKGDLAVATRRLDQAEADLEAERELATTLRGRLAAFGWGLPAEEELFRVTRDRDMDDAPADDGTGAAARREPDFAPTAPSGGEPAAGNGAPSGAGPKDPWQSTVDRVPGDRIPPPPPPPPAPLGEAETTPANAATAGQGATAPKRRATLERSPAIAQQIQKRVNRLLEGGRSNTTGAWQVSKVGGFTRDMLGEVNLLEYDDADRMIGNIEADEVRIEYDVAQEVVELVVVGGRRVRGRERKAEKIPTGGLRLVVARGPEMIKMWRKSGLVMVKPR